MSRKYHMQVQIEGYDLEKQDDIGDVVNDLLGGEGWFDRQDNNTKALTFEADTYLCGGESEEEFFARVHNAVWNANGDKYCSVLVHQTYMEDLPTNGYETSEGDFDDYKAPEKTEDE